MPPDLLLRSAFIYHVHQFLPALEERRPLCFDLNTLARTRVASLVAAILAHLSKEPKPRIFMRPPSKSRHFILPMVVSKMADQHWMPCGAAAGAVVFTGTGRESHSFQ